MSIDYERSFKRLVDEIKGGYENVANCIEQSKEAGCSYSDIAADEGMLIAYESIKDLAEKLEKGEYDFRFDCHESVEPPTWEDYVACGEA